MYGGPDMWTAPLLLLAVPLLPAAAAVAITLFRPGENTSARLALWSTAASAMAAMAVVALSSRETVEAVATVADGEIAIGLAANRVGAVLALLTMGVGLVVQSFSTRALAGDPRAPRFFALTAVLTAATATVATGATLILVTLAWMLSGLVLLSLLNHHEGSEPARRASRMTGRRFALGDIALAVAAVLAAASVGDIDVRSQEATVEAMAATSVPLGPTDVSMLTIVALLLVIAGISRSALVPLHGWLPATLAAPTPVSALLHAGVVNGAGVLLVRFAEVFGAVAVATHLAFVAGAATVVFGTGVMLTRTDVKGSLAWSTIGQMGFMVVQCAAGAFSAALFHILGHGMYKAAMFLGAGGAITAHHRARLRPPPRSSLGRVHRMGVAALVPAVSLALAYALLDPHLSPAGHLLVMLFAWFTGFRLLTGWLAAAPLGRLASTISAAAIGVAGTVAYVGGLTTFEGYVNAAMPADVPAAVTPQLVAGTLFGLALMLVALRWLPGALGLASRRRAYALLVAAGTPSRHQTQPLPWRRL